MRRLDDNFAVRDLTVDAATPVASNTSLSKLRTAQPRFVRTTYRALGL